MNMITNIIMKIEKSDFQLINNALITFKKDAGEGYPTMMSFIEKCSKKGFVLNNVDKIVLIDLPICVIATETNELIVNPCSADDQTIPDAFL